jgi:hypothetical protein
LLGWWPDYAELPLSMSEDDLRGLLDACGPYSPDPAIERPIWDGPGTADPILPLIQIEHPPGGLGDGRLKSEPEGRHWSALTELLQQSEQLFWESHPPTQ